LSNLSKPRLNKTNGTCNGDHSKVIEDEIGIGLDSCLQAIPDSNMFLIQTTDYFYPLINDPYKMGWIACNNVISDLYAMGVTRIDNVLMLLATSTKFTPKERDVVIPKIMSGFRDCCYAAGTEVRGGQTARNPWVLLGGCATSVLPRDKFVMPNAAVPGDVLICTKPLGTQVAVNLNQWMDLGDEARMKDLKFLTSESIVKAYSDATISMMTLNRNAASIMVKHGAHAATDITGFGILGHAANLAEAQKAKVKMVIEKLPILKHMHTADKALGGMFKLLDGKSAETSGGLLIAIPKNNAEAFVKELKEMGGHDVWIIGHVTEGDRNAQISDSVTVIEVESNASGKLVSV